MDPDIAAVRRLQVALVVARLDLRDPLRRKGLDLLRRCARRDCPAIARDQRDIGGMPRDLLLAHLPEFPHPAIEEHRIEIAIEQHDAVLHVLERPGQHLQLVRRAHDVGYGRVAHHPAAVGQRRALTSDDITIAAPEIDRVCVPYAHEADAFGKVGFELLGRQIIGHGLATVTHQIGEAGGAVRNRVRKHPHVPKRAVDEQGFQFGIQQQDADRDQIERRAQRQHVPAQNVAAASLRNGERCGTRRCGSRRGCRSCSARPLLLKREAELPVRLPQSFARPHLVGADEQQLNVVGNADRGFEFHGRPGIGELPDRAIER